MLHEVKKWSIRVRKEFNGVFVTKTKFVLYKDEKTEVVEMDITELRKLKEFMEHYKDPYEAGNTEHVDNLK